MQFENFIQGFTLVFNHLAFVCGMVVASVIIIISFSLLFLGIMYILDKLGIS